MKIAIIFLHKDIIAFFIRKKKTMNKVKEGDLYKTIKISNHVFDIKYGYYEETDRYSKYSELIPIFPNLLENPLYTEEGYLIATQMQDGCAHFEGEKNLHLCLKCMHYKKVDDLMGVCFCISNQKN